MPTHLPNRPRAKAIQVDDARNHEPRPHGRRKHPIDTIDWLALWTLSLAFSALFIAGSVFFGEGDRTGAAAVLVGTAAIMALALRITKAPDELHNDANADQLPGFGAKKQRGEPSGRLQRQ